MKQCKVVIVHDLEKLSSSHAQLQWLQAALLSSYMWMISVSIKLLAGCCTNKAACLAPIACGSQRHLVPNPYARLQCTMHIAYSQAWQVDVHLLPTGLWQLQDINNSNDDNASQLMMS